MASTISLPMIVKNEQHNIGLLLDTVCPIIEEVIIVDTGSTDNTLNIIAEKQKIFSNIRLEHFEWIKDFSAARNYAFSFATQDWVWFLDGDDYVDPQELRTFKAQYLDDPNVDCWLLDYVYARLPNGDPYTVLGRERFMRRSCNPTWHGAIHETVMIWNMRQRHYPHMKVWHERGGKTYDINRNVEILESEFSKNPKDARTAYYLGKELFDRINPRGLEVLRHFLTLDGKYFDDEVNARFRLACDDLVNNRLTEAIHHAEAIYHADSSRMRAECYWIYGNVEQKLRNFKVAVRWYERCLDGEPPSPRVINREYYSWNPMYRISECYREMGDIPSAITWFNKVKKIIPTGSMVDDLENSILGRIKKAEFYVAETLNQPLRNDSQQFPEGYDFGVFGKEKFKGLVANECTDHSIVEKGGFVWTLVPCNLEGLGYLGEAIYGGVKVHNYVKIIEQSPSFYFPDGDLDFGPYRLRINNLKKSCIKNGYPLNNSNPDYVVSQNLNVNYFPGSKHILDVCEWLPDRDYSSYGIDKAEYISCSSPLLAELMQGKFPDKKVMTVEDHIDFGDQEWL